MLMKILKWLGIAIGAIVAIILCIYGYFTYKTNSVLSKKYEIPASSAIYVPGDSLTLARGKHLAEVLCECVHCHGVDFAGAKVIDFPPLAQIYGSNLTAGKGGHGAHLGIKEFERAVRHGVTHDDRTIAIMPSYHYCYLSDEDVAALFAYFKTMPPVDKTQPEITFGPIGKMLIATGKAPLIGAELINHSAKRPPRPPIGVTAEYGEYIARLACIGCHHPDLSGGIVETGDPSWPPAANLTRGGIAATYTLDNFKHLLRTGERPGGNKVNEAMSVEYLKYMTDDEINALWLYLQSIPAKPMGSSDWFTSKAP